MKPKAQKKGWSAALAIAFLTALFLSLPYLIGHMTAPSGSVFTGLLVNIEDGTYLSAIEQGRAGAWLYKSHFTAEAHDPVFLEGFYLMLGQIARLAGLSTVAMWHIGLFATNLLLFLIIFAFISLFLQSNRERLTAYLLALLGAGFDWWRFPLWFEREAEAALEVVPMDLRFPEAHIFYSALTFPHFTAGIALILLVFGLALYMLTLPINSNKRRLLAVGAGIANLLLGIVYPFLIFLTVVVSGVFYLYLLWRRLRSGRLAGQSFSWRQLDWREIGLMAVIFIIPLPLFLYYAAVFLESHYLRTWSDQAFTPSPNPLHYLLTYGLYLFLGILYPLKRRRTSGRQKVDQLPQAEGSQSPYSQLKVSFLWLWVGSAAVLLYLPLNSQRRYVEGLHVPLAILATIGFFAVVWPRLLKTRWLAALLRRPRYSAAGMQRLTVLALVGVAGLANLYLYSSTLLELGVRQPYPLFRPAAEIEAMAWLKEQLQPGDIVLTSYRTGSFLPYQTGATVTVGNRYETTDFERKRQEAAQFFQPETTDQWRQNLLAQDNIRYVFAGPEERSLGGDSIMMVEYLEPVYQNEEVTIYLVQETQGPSE